MLKLWDCGGAKPALLGTYAACPAPSHAREPCGVVAIAFDAASAPGSLRAVCGTKQVGGGGWGRGKRRATG